MHHLDQTPVEFWESHYDAMSPRSNGIPGKILVRFVDSLAPASALELGCGRGDDAVWLAKKGWQVTAVDLSYRALEYAAANAQRSGVSKQLVFAQYDLTYSFPAGRYDLIVASFLESPLSFDRFTIFRTALTHVAPGGMLLITSHAKPPSWSQQADRPFQSAKEAIVALEPLSAEWEILFCDDVARIMRGPDGQEGEVSDSVIALRRKE
ncbi:class I SAM-dependent methyltransferase [Citrobacter sp. MNAZ 1397]|uniref:class I SAM-dependent methyltransferase n=1 Tax=Citrobacter sp. MNAZ 1397 TaxID=2911205 RepID=UPI0020276390|nr:class I SAM-dependent methyltransferase [Citrobacter sp. MNAZ 1397]MCL9674463.1 class I SAM-dependent methyltransferase [Citrobacter sp. MNAZ 1397]